MRRVIHLLILSIIASYSAVASAQPTASADSVRTAVFGVINRMLPGRASSFTVDVIPSENGLDVFEYESVNGKIALRGSGPSAILSGLNWYLKYNAKVHFSWTGDQMNPAAELPAVPEKVRVVSPYKYRYIYNYCTFDYTMPFWTWKEWERELDFIALNGVNLALASVVGQEALWQNVMRRLGFTEKKIFDFIPGPAYQAWWLMDNLEGWGGPVSQRWIDDRAALQKKILARMSELGIEPLMQGFFGMVPRAAMARYPDAGIIETGIWGGGFKRPPMLLPSNPRFAEFAKVWYEEQTKLFGDARFFGGDPFHEGEFAAVNLTDVGVGIQNAMLANRPDSIWALQGWGANPSPLLLKGLKKKNVLIMDLQGERNSPLWRIRDGFRGYPWTWNIISNFGGKTGTHGSMARVAKEPIEALSHYRKYLVGVGGMMEGSGMNAPLWDLLYEMGWRSSKPDLDKWFDDFAERRYGKTTPGVKKAWKLLADSVYQGRGGYEEDERSLFCRRPNDQVGTVLSGYGVGPYDPCKLRTALRTMLDEANAFRGVKTYEYDLVDLTREYLSNANILVHQKMILAYRAKDKKNFETYAAMFLNMILDEDTLLSTDRHFLLGPWLESAKSVAPTAPEKTLFEWNARTLITTWGDRAAFGGLDDYASREWAGTLRTYYYMRWKLFIDNLRAGLNGKPQKEIDWFAVEEPWARDKTLFATEPSGDPIVESRRVFSKYASTLVVTCGQR